MRIGPKLRRVIPVLNRRRLPMGDRLHDAGAAGGRLARRIWGATIAFLLAADLALTVTKTENRWSDLIDACLGYDRVPPAAPAPPVSPAAPPVPRESLERLMGPGR